MLTRDQNTSYNDLKEQQDEVMENLARLNLELQNLTWEDVVPAKETFTKVCITKLLHKSVKSEKIDQKMTELIAKSPDSGNT